MEAWPWFSVGQGLANSGELKQYVTSFNKKNKKKAECIDLYTKNWSKREHVDLKYLSKWKDHLKELVTDRISNLKGHFKSPKCKVLDQPDVKDTLHKLHANYVLVPADKAANNVIIVCKKYYIDTLVKELGINNVNISNPTYIPTDDSF